MHCVFFNLSGLIDRVRRIRLVKGADIGDLVPVVNSAILGIDFDPFMVCRLLKKKKSAPPSESDNVNYKHLNTQFESWGKILVPKENEIINSF